MANSNPQLTITITGGSGFLGTELTRTLLEAGHRVRIVDFYAPDTSIHNQVEFIEGDINDAAVLERAVPGSDLVYHIAALVPISKKSKKDFLRANVEGTRTVLEACKKAGARVVFCSTSSPMYDKATVFPVTEETPLSPGYTYGHSKHAAEMVCNEYRQKGLKITIVRPRMIIGPGRLGLIEIISEWVRRGDPIPLLGDGSNRLQFLDVHDLVDFLVRLASAQDDVFNQNYNIGAKTFTTFKQDLQAMITAAHSSSRFVPLPRIYRPLLVLCNTFGFTPFTFFHLNTIDRTFYFDTTKAEKNLGWHSTFSNAESLVRSYKWYIENRNTIQVGDGHRKKLKHLGLATAVPFLLRIYDKIVS